MIASIEILTEKQCQDVYRRIYTMRDHWVARGGSPSYFFTLGAVSYLDASQPAREADHYYKMAQKYNVLLREQFGWLYDTIQSSLERHLEAPAIYQEYLALPGFHVWLTPAVFTKPRAAVHFDLQYKSLRWPEGVDLMRLLSFTLAIKLPVAGGGLNIWDTTYDEFMKAYNKGWVEGAADMQRFKTLTYYPYTVGKLVVHSGNILHQVAPIREVQEGDERVTLQGHGVWCNGQWLFYW